MELQLGLALPSMTDDDDDIIKGLDIDLNNYYGYESFSWNHNNNNNNYDNGGSGSVSSKCSSSSSTNNDEDMCSIISSSNNKKRSFDDAFEQAKAVPRTLPLLNWNNKKPVDDGDDHLKELDNYSSFGSNKTIDEDGVVGWPPIKNSRKKLCYHGGVGVKNNQTTVAANGNNSISMFVKVKTEGVAIARKIDLSLYDSFETLTNTLINMFGLWHEDSHNYQLTYQDREGDWLIAQDVPWRAFIGTVQRLKLSKRRSSR